MLHSHRLCALNTWGRKEPTYRHPSGKSQIDFILVRRALADGVAKRCAVWKTPLAGWRSSGHESLKASIKLHWKPWSLRGHKTVREDVGGSNTSAGAAIRELRGQLAGQPTAPVVRVARPALVGWTFWSGPKALPQRAIANPCFSVFVYLHLGAGLALSGYVMLKGVLCTHALNVVCCRCTLPSSSRPGGHRIFAAPV